MTMQTSNENNNSNDNTKQTHLTTVEAILCHLLPVIAATAQPDAEDTERKPGHAAYSAKHHTQEPWLFH